MVALAVSVMNVGVDSDYYPFPYCLMKGCNAKTCLEIGNALVHMLVQEGFDPPC